MMAVTKSTAAYKEYQTAADEMVMFDIQIGIISEPDFFSEFRYMLYSVWDEHPTDDWPDTAYWGLVKVFT